MKVEFNLGKLFIKWVCVIGIMLWVWLVSGLYGKVVIV